MFTFEVTPDNGEPYQVTALSRDVVRWERTGKNRSLSDFRGRLQYTDVYSLSHAAVTRQGLYAGSLAEWETSVDVKPVADEDDEDDDGPDPTQPAH